MTPIEAERFRSFVMAVADYAIYMLSPDGIVRSWNAGARRFKGYEAEEIIGQHFSRFYTEEDRAAGMPARTLQTAIDEGKFEGEGWRVRKDGTRFWASVVLDPIRDESGELVGFAKITRDITERKQAALALRESEERFRLLVEGVTDYAIYMLGPDGTITNWNAGAKRIKGYEQQEVIGSNFARFYTEEDRAAGMPQRALAIAAREGRFESEGRRVRKDGTVFWAHVVVDPIRDEMGSLIGFAKVTRDVTERREAAAALERTREALFQSQKLEAIGKLTGGVAHDFNNLLNVIVSGLELLRREVQSPTGGKVVDGMQRAAERASTLTQQLLAFARQQPLKQERHNLNAVIASFEAVLRRAAKNTVAMHITLAPQLPAVMIDAPQFEAAVLNLIVNAADATPDGGGIVLSTQMEELAADQVGSLPAGRYVRVTVADNGSGMPPDVVKRAVEPFFTTKPIGKGTGMGLSQVYGLVQQSGGELHIESTVGEGTAISLYLPALADAAGDDAGYRGSDTREKALVVDDQPDVLDMAVELFRNLGYEVFSANNGRDALEILQRTPDIDVLFSDVAMPEMNGIQLGRKARELAPTLKVLLASGYPAPVLRAENADIDSFQLIVKPYRISEVMRKLRAAG
ncbi:PAS domain-containing sensor histidine kinase [Oxalobacteraceae bacterium OM1]|nr:PAS domain-containing sensor histidine kinase [Oxalobacteraceae bacterium OM1]